MAIKTTGPLNFQDIVDEFGGSGEAKLSEYYRGGGKVPNTNANAAIAVSPGELKLSQFYGARKEIFLTYTAYGGGGSGGNGLADGNGTGSNPIGNTTGLLKYDSYKALSENGANQILGNISNQNFVTDARKAAGGTGGGHGNMNSITGGTGGGSDFGVGGTGGTPNVAAPSATWGHWGAAGGGGGGDDGSTSYFNLYGSDAAGAAGSGGGASVKVENIQVIVDVEVWYVIHVGGGGAPGASYNYRGAAGVPGRFSFTTSMDGDEATYTVESPRDGTSASHFTENTVRFIKLGREGGITLQSEYPG